MGFRFVRVVRSCQSPSGQNRCKGKAIDTEKESGGNNGQANARKCDIFPFHCVVPYVIPLGFGSVWLIGAPVRGSVLTGLIGCVSRSGWWFVRLPLACKIRNAQILPCLQSCSGQFRTRFCRSNACKGCKAHHIVVASFKPLFYPLGFGFSYVFKLVAVRGIEPRQVPKRLKVVRVVSSASVKVPQLRTLCRCGVGNNVCRHRNTPNLSQSIRQDCPQILHMLLQVIPYYGKGFHLPAMR